MWDLERRWPIEGNRAAIDPESSIHRVEMVSIR